MESLELAALRLESCSENPTPAQQEAHTERVLAVSQLIVFGGLPGTGKSTLARELSSRRGCPLLRVDEIEAALWRAGISREQPTGLAAYLLAETIAENCLRVGGEVIVDAVNPVEEARETWRELAGRTGASLRFVEVVCSDLVEHRRRVRERSADIEGQRVPSWEQVRARHYQPWRDPRLILDSNLPAQTCQSNLDAYLSEAWLS